MPEGPPDPDPDRDPERGPAHVALAPVRAVVAVLRFLVRHRQPIVIVALLVGLGAAGAAGARLLLRDPSPPAADVVCWDGALAAPSDCTRPEGADGLAWVFPSFDPTDQRCREVTDDGDPTATTVWTCGRTLGGEAVTLTYAVHTDVPDTLARIRSRYRGVTATRSDGGRRAVWRSPTADDGRYTLVEAYTGAPYSVEVTASTATTRDRALSAFVRLRQPEHLRTRP